MNRNGPDNRNERRYRIGLEAGMQAGETAEEPVRVTNLSHNGCRFAAGREFPVGSKISLRAGLTASIAGEVRWRVDTIHGVEFAQPIPDPLLDHIRLFLSEQAAYLSDIEEQTDGAVD